VWRAGVSSNGFVPLGVTCHVLPAIGDVDAWVAASRADLSVGRVTHTVGGSSRARARWDEYVKVELLECPTNY